MRMIVTVQQLTIAEQWFVRCEDEQEITVSRINSIRITRSNSNSTSHAINYNEIGLLNVDPGMERDTYRIVIGQMQT
jgi:hypothetical protein